MVVSLTLFFSVGGEVYNTRLPGQSKNINPSGALFEAVRTARFSAVYKVGYSPQCCRSHETGNANTPYNQTCARGMGNDLGFVPRWLETPLLFDLASDVGQEAPLVPGSALHKEALAAIAAVLARQNTSLHDGKLQSVPSYAHDLAQKVCCNESNVVCRCEELKLKTDGS